MGRNSITQFKLHKIYRKQTISVFVLQARCNIQISVMGGDRPHIGAVSIADLNGHISTFQFPGHRESIISERWVKCLYENGCSPVVVCAGIHYDNLNRDEIETVLRLTDELLLQVLEKLHDSFPC